MTPHNIEVLIDRQMRRWDLQQVSEVTSLRPPCMALSRLPHSGAAEIGQRVAERLDYGFFGREIVDEIASEEGVNAGIVAGVDEHVESAIERHVLDGFRHRKFTETDYLRDAVRIVSTLGMRGRTIVRRSCTRRMK